MTEIAGDIASQQAMIDKRHERARKEIDDRMGNARSQARNWRMATFASLLLLTFAILGIIYLGSLPKAVPHIVEVDKLGHAVYAGPAGLSWRNYTPTDASKRYHLRRFVENTRSLSADPIVTRNSWTDAYKLLTQSGASVLSEFARENNPFARMKDERVEVGINSIIPISPDSWSIEWTETRWGTRGNQMGRESWKGIFNLTFHEPKTEQQLIDNPIGLFIDSFSWARDN